MADYWKSNDRKHCDFCNCWLADNKASIAFHESGKRHKMNVANRLAEISKNSEKNERERSKMANEIRKMEEAAMRSYAQDIHARGDFTAKNIEAMMAANSASTSSAVISYAKTDVAAARNARQVDPMRLAGNSDDETEEGGVRVMVRKVDPESVPNATLWVEAMSDEGHTYYWNVKTNESVWEPPKEGFLSWAEYQRINDLALKQQELQQAADAKHFRDNANEEVARFNRERMKKYRKPETKEEKQTKAEHKASFRTEEEATTQKIGSWQVVEAKPPPPVIDLQLPKVNSRYIPPVVSEIPVEPPVKRFKEKTIQTLNDDDEASRKTLSSFKKRKFAAKGNARQRLNDD